ncbi:hypothetical protein F5878DRAFT_672001 [Lentinula raphanica]|uniref:Uncharacterized protein n=1 Tax=Lentinula raphanica TaxID=153919 RepID=A0AA38NWK5_9AGAR|nr:hypothetical protein F5878DRAFT_672001 [Lentinula raphanica]
MPLATCTTSPSVSTPPEPNSIHITLSYRTTKELKARMDLLPRVAPWQLKKLIMNPSYSTKKPDYLSAIEVLQDILTSPLMQDHLAFTPLQIFGTAAKSIRIYDSWLSSEQAWRTSSRTYFNCDYLSKASHHLFLLLALYPILVFRHKFCTAPVNNAAFGVMMADPVAKGRGKMTPFTTSIYMDHGDCFRHPTLSGNSTTVATKADPNDVERYRPSSIDKDSRSSSRRFTIPSRQPPPLPRESLVPSPAVSEIYNLLVHPMIPKPTCRPPPRISIPADFGFFPEDGGQVESEEEDDCDNIITYYVEAKAVTESSASSYSHPFHVKCFSISDLNEEFQSSIETEINHPMVLPLSLPNSPIDLKADIAHGLAEMRMRPEANAPTDKVSDDLPILTKPAAPVEPAASLLARRQMMRRNMTVSVPLTFDCLPPPLLSPADEQSEGSELCPQTSIPNLQSRWSTSTLSEQQSHGWRSSKLWLYFRAAPKSELCLLHPVYYPQSLPPPRRSPKASPSKQLETKKRAVRTAPVNNAAFSVMMADPVAKRRGKMTPFTNSIYTDHGDCFRHPTLSGNSTTVATNADPIRTMNWESEWAKHTVRDARAL